MYDQTTQPASRTITVMTQLRKGPLCELDGTCNIKIAIMVGVSAKQKLSLLNTPQDHCSRATAHTLSLADFIGDNALISNKGNIADKELDEGNIADKIGNSQRLGNDEAAITHGRHQPRRVYVTLQLCSRIEVRKKGTFVLLM